MIAFWDIAPCILVEVDLRFRGAYCLCHRPSPLRETEIPCFMGNRRLTSIRHCRLDFCRLYLATGQDFLHFIKYRVSGLNQLFTEDLWSADILRRSPLLDGICRMEGIIHNFLQNSLQNVILTRVVVAVEVIVVVTLKVVVAVVVTSHFL
jgi:hypothetical protein